MLDLVGLSVLSVIGEKFVDLVATFIQRPKLFDAPFVVYDTSAVEIPFGLSDFLHRSADIAPSRL